MNTVQIDSAKGIIITDGDSSDKARRSRCHFGLAEMLERHPEIKFSGHPENFMPVLARVSEDLPDGSTRFVRTTMALQTPAGVVLVFGWKEGGAVSQTSEFVHGVELYCDDDGFYRLRKMEATK